jgi:hypothetical protein
MQIAKEPIDEMLEHLDATGDQLQPDSFQTKWNHQSNAE